MGTQTKTCRACVQEIDRRARKCPHCTALQGLYLVGPVLLYVFLLLFLASAIGLVILACFVVKRDLDKGRDDYSGVVRINNSRLVGSTDEGLPSFFIVGTLTSNAPVELDSIQLQADCYNADGELIDTLEKYIYMVVRPGKPLAFKFSPATERPLEKVASHTVSVRAATGPPADD